MLFVSDHVGVIGLNGVTLTLLSWDACNDNDSRTVQSSLIRQLISKSPANTHIISKSAGHLKERTHRLSPLISLTICLVLVTCDWASFDSESSSLSSRLPQLIWQEPEGVSSMLGTSIQPPVCQQATWRTSSSRINYSIFTNDPVPKCLSGLEYTLHMLIFAWHLSY